MKVVITMLARNTEATLKETYDEIPAKYKKFVILSDDSSTDSTTKIAEKLGVKVYKNNRKPGYGSNAKNCFRSALKEGADIVVILHSDNQYDATKIPALVKLIEDGKAEFTIGSRILGDKAKNMSAFRFIGNRFLGFMQNLAMGAKITDLHSGLVAIKTDLLRKIPFELDSNDHVFHVEMILQSHYAGARFGEVGIPTRYEDCSQSISIRKSIKYGFETIFVLLKYLLHKHRIKKFRQFIIKKSQ